ncbi:MAG: hypothetical protein Q9220_007009 [cf. Caloplaca sp. 1 TL-2023]
MEGTSFQSIFESPIIEISLGDSSKTFHAHASVLSKSEVLQKSLNGCWKENEESKLDWPNWTVSGVEKLLDWLYTRDYTCPYPTLARESKVSSDEESDTKEGGESNSEDNYTTNTPVMLKMKEGFGRHRASRKSQGNLEVEVPNEGAQEKKDTSDRQKASLEGLTWEGLRPLEQISQAEEYKKWTGHILWRPEELDYGATLLTHAELYVMACQYLLIDLKSMAWQRLQAVLISIGPLKRNTPVIGNLVALLSYIYQETSNDGKDPLRMLVTTFASLSFTDFQGPDVDRLMKSTDESDREFVADFMLKVAEKVILLESENETIRSRDRMSLSTKLEH